ncbi:MAG TPA: hypothetical protein PLG50_03315 [bacterium]|nr:hypothetical protein [bacterium]HQG44671.1 hypothetical protein [bacterium]HQI49447.1 hypothetical protein [bacterium]HQJ63499.1 hypothetical protein [bacterium]
MVLYNLLLASRCPRRGRRIFPLLLVVLIYGSAAGLGQSKLAQGYDELQQRLRVLQQQNAALTAASDSLAVEIQRQKEGEPLNLFARRRLERALRSAQELARRREENLRLQSGLQMELAHRAAALDSCYAAAIDSLLKTAGPLQGSQRQKVEDLRSRRTALQGVLSSGTGGLDLVGSVRINPNDLPEEITVKADLLRAREGQLRAQAQSLARRAGQIKQEGALRKKMADLVSDVSLFEQRDEMTQRTNRSPESEISTATNKGNVSIRGEPGTVMEPASPAEQLLRLDLRSLSTEDADVLLHELESQRRMLLMRADSLAVRALHFDAEAERLRTQLKQTR